MGVRLIPTAAVAFALALACALGPPGAAADRAVAGEALDYIPWPSVLPGRTVGPAGPPVGLDGCPRLRMWCVTRLIGQLRDEYEANDAACDHRVIFSLGYLGLEVDTARNVLHASIISRDASRVVVRVIPTDEDLMIARHTHRLILEEAANHGDHVRV